MARARVGELAGLPGGRNNRVFPVGSGLGGAVVVKVYRGMDRAEWEVRALRVMAGSGPMPQRRLERVGGYATGGLGAAGGPRRPAGDGGWAGSDPVAAAGLALVRVMRVGVVDVKPSP